MVIFHSYVKLPEGSIYVVPARNLQVLNYSSEVSQSLPSMLQSHITVPRQGTGGLPPVSATFPGPNSRFRVYPMSGKLNFKDQTFWKAIMKEHHACLHGRSRLCLNDGRCPAKTIYIPFAKTLTVKMQGNIENDQPFVSPLRYCMCVVKKCSWSLPKDRPDCEKSHSYPRLRLWATQKAWVHLEISLKILEKSAALGGSDFDHFRPSAQKSGFMWFQYWGPKMRMPQWFPEVEESLTPS